MTTLKLLCVVSLGICLSMFAPAPAAGATLSTNAAWTWIKGADLRNQPGTYGTPGVPATINTPGAREGAVSWTDTNNALWLFGGSGLDGVGNEGNLNDLWKYDVLGGISLNTNALVFSATYQGANPAAQMIGLTNIGGTAFTYTNLITYGAGASGWLTVLPAAGTCCLR